MEEEDVVSTETTREVAVTLVYHSKNGHVDLLAGVYCIPIATLMF